MATTILLIEDEDQLRQNVATALTHEGFEVITADRGMAGLELAYQHLPDVILSDIMMPDVDGYEVLEAVRNHIPTSTTPVILITAKNAREDQRLGMTMGADDYITKPFRMHELLSSISTQLIKRDKVSTQLDTSMRKLRHNIIYALPHEMRTPLNLILGFAQIIELDAGSAPADEISDSARRILAAGQRLHHLVENYLVYAQLEVIAGDPVQMAALRSEILDNAAEVIAGRATARAQVYNRIDDLHLHLSPVSLPITERNLGKIIDELVDNALKFSEAGMPIVIQSGEQGGWFHLEIADLGRGMSREQICALGAYIQFDREVYEQQGIGFGLVIARRLVHLHGGHFEISSELGSGTRIHVALPL